jgi:PIN domain nuclease of toxin-antitoxin system
MLTASDRLNAITQAALQDSTNTFFVSPITLWETYLLIEKRRLPVNLAPEEWIRMALRSSGVQAAPLTHAIAIAASRSSRSLYCCHRRGVWFELNDRRSAFTHTR